MPPRRQAPPEEPGALDLRPVTRAAHEANVALARRLGVGLTDVQALDHLLSAPTSPGELAERLGLRPASVTAVVDRLERAGHVERRPHPDDRRRQVLVATPHAQREAFAALRPLLAELGAAADHMSDAERLAAARYLERVRAALAAFAREDR